MIGRFFHTPSAKKFNITPRYWDPDKDDREDRERRIREELGIPEVKKENTGPVYRPNVKGQFRRAQDGFSRSSDHGRRASNNRLVILIVILTLIFYLFFYSDFLF